MDSTTRNHTRKRLWHLVQDVKQHLHGNGPWRYAPSELYYTPEVTAAVEALRAGKIYRTLSHNLPLECTNVMWFDLARKTNHVERFNYTLRQRVSRLVHATLSFSKNLANHIGAIRYFICDYNLTKCAVLLGSHYQTSL